MRKEPRDSPWMVHGQVEAHDCAIAEPYEGGTSQIQPVHHADDVLGEAMIPERLRRACTSPLTACVDDDSSVSIFNEAGDEKAPIVRRVFPTFQKDDGNTRSI